MAQEQEQSLPALPKTFVLNLILLQVFGTFVSWWIYYYTDLFPAFLSILAAGGLTSWLAFVFRFISEDRLKAIQHGLDQRILNNSFTMTIVGPFLVFLLILACFLGSLQIESLGAAEHSVVVDSPDNRWRLPSGGELRKAFWTSWFAPRTIQLKVSGYPTQTFRLLPWKREKLKVPDSFFRPVILLRPKPQLVRLVRGNSMKITLSKGSDAAHLARVNTIAFNGGSLWIGCDEDVSVPPEKQALWNSESPDPGMLSGWQYPRTFPGLEGELRPGTVFKVEILNAQNVPYTTSNFRVQSLQNSRDFPQVVDLDAP